ncbi:MAG: hypothetical protein JW776_09435 [Candidatus Lokiarchaeota archaeon]|nr:hypothetical protein [Candidatus Lokiarchaeota archaeon]
MPFPTEFVLERLYEIYKEKTRKRDQRELFNVIKVFINHPNQAMDLILNSYKKNICENWSRLNNRQKTRFLKKKQKELQEYIVFLSDATKDYAMQIFQSTNKIPIEIFSRYHDQFETVGDFQDWLNECREEDSSLLSSSLFDKIQNVEKPKYVKLVEKVKTDPLLLELIYHWSIQMTGISKMDKRFEFSTTIRYFTEKHNLNENQARKIEEEVLSVFEELEIDPKEVYHHKREKIAAYISDKYSDIFVKKLKEHFAHASKKDQNIILCYLNHVNELETTWSNKSKHEFDTEICRKFMQFYHNDFGDVSIECDEILSLLIHFGVVYLSYHKTTNVKNTDPNIWRHTPPFIKKVKL